MTKTIVLIHGAWVTSESWATFRQPFEAAGYSVHTPTWPLLDGFTAAEINARPPEGFGALTVGRVVDHLQRFIEALPEQPILIGHSFGGLYTQLLLDRGVGAAGVALNPVLIGGIVPGPTTLGAALPILLRPNGWNRPYAFTRERWFRRFANGAPRALSDEAYDTYVIPAPSRIFYQAASWIGTLVDPRRRTAPLLITEGDADRLVTPYLSRSAFNIQRRSAARTDYAAFPGQSHFLIAEPGWERVADTALRWIQDL
ncbi:alpha/beta fold hydrolase [Caulobacter sp. SLTY]|uniref:alpha/beta hydrolase n=1 Tax=Caulobacter sp. SLTY TaxID=2683262 RepID=UPI0014126FDC|nr:alpha/beta fold hydrolase [Caulobacter sp. SLTY]NBB14394.1 alpha/beta fold hydrolase [Caulobacter sp. SLTY]